MPDPLDLPQDIGPNNAYLEDIRPIGTEEFQHNMLLLAFNPRFSREAPQDPFDILVQCEEEDERKGCVPGTHLQLYYETHASKLTSTRRSTK